MVQCLGRTLPHSINLQTNCNVNFQFVGYFVMFNRSINIHDICCTVCHSLQNITWNIVNIFAYKKDVIKCAATKTTSTMFLVDGHRGDVSRVEFELDHLATFTVGHAHGKNCNRKCTGRRSAGSY